MAERLLSESFKRSEIFALQEHSFWDITRKINEIEGYRNYLKIFPHGKFFNNAKTQINRLLGKIDDESKEAFPIISFDSIGSFTEFGLAPASYNGKYGYINDEWQEVIPFMYEWASNFSNGTAEIRLNGRIKIINHKGEIIE